MATFLLRSVHSSTRRCPANAASWFSGNLLLPRFMGSRPSSDQTLCNQSSTSLANSPSAREIEKAKPQPRHSNDVLSSSSSLSKAHLYVDLATALRSPPGTFTRNQMFEIWCKNFPKSCASEEEKLHRFELFNYFLDQEMETMYGNDNGPKLNEISHGAPNEISNTYYDRTDVKETGPITGEKEEAREVNETSDLRYSERVYFLNGILLQVFATLVLFNEVPCRHPIAMCSFFLLNLILYPMILDKMILYAMILDRI